MSIKKQKLSDMVRREGLSILHDPQNCDFDLVIIHGLNGHPYRTFYDEPTGFYWPTHICTLIPTARVMVFGYIADINTGPSNILGVYQHAESLLLHLKNNRIGSQQEQRSIVFLAHSLGGLVVKQALIHSSHNESDNLILRSTKLIFFLGTPHRGSHILDKPLAKVVLSAMKLGKKEVPSNIKSILQPRANESFMVNTDFMRVKGQIPIVNFYEQLPVHHLQELVVEKDSAVFDSDYSENIPVARDHQHLVRFESATDDAYRTLWQTLKRKLAPILSRTANLAENGSSQRMMIACMQSLGKWGTSINPIHEREAHHKTLGWLWDADSELLKWLETGSGLFSITGKPGSGKSLLMNEVTRRVRKKYRNQFPVVVQHVFNARGTRRDHSFEGFLRHALGQILRQCPSSFDAMLDEWIFAVNDSGFTQTDVYNSEDAGSVTWSLASLKASLHAITTYASQQSRVCFIIDALEECDGDNHASGGLVEFLESLGTIYSSSLAVHTVCVCFSSRDPPSVKPSSITGKFKMEDRNGPDIDAYINDRWSTIISSAGAGSDIKQLKHELIRKADGVFLWANLALERIKTALADGATVAELREAINDTPDELGGLFNLLLDNINRAYLKETNVMLAIALAAYRPLNLREFRYAIALSTVQSVSSHKELLASANVVQDDPAMKRRIRSRCGGLLEVKDVENDWLENPDSSNLNYTSIVQFMHQSVKDYLLLKESEESAKKHECLISQGHAILSRCSLHYLSLKETQELAARVGEGSGLDKPSQASTLEELPFLNYAVEFCFQHCSDAENHGNPQLELTDKVFGLDDRIFKNYVSMYNATHRGEEYSLGYSLLHLAVENNLARYVELRLSRSAAEVNALLEGGQSYVQVAVWKEHTETLKVLLAHGADVNLSLTPSSRDEASYRVSYKYLHPLVVACQNGNLEMVQMLLGSGADVSDCTVNYRGMRVNEALVSAAYSGNIEIVQTILDSDPVAFSHPEIRLGTMIGLYDAMSELVFEESREHQQQRHKARINSKLQLIQETSQLIFRGIDLYQLDFESIPASMVWLMTGCYPEVLQQLIELGTDFSGIEGNGLSFLHVACLQGTVASVRLLLQNKASLDFTYGEDDISCLQLSLLNHTPAVLSYLLQIGVPVNATDRSGSTALHEAAAGCPAEYIDILLHHNADRGSLDVMRRRPFHCAIYNGILEDHVDMLEKLLYQESDINLPDDNGLTPLHMAANSSSVSVVRWLIREGADMAARDDSGRTVLHLAAASSSPDSADVLAYLLSEDKTIDVNARDSADMTALHHLFYTYDSIDIYRTFDPSVTTTNAKLLVEAGASLDVQDNAGNTPLHLAAWRGVKGLVSFFLRQGADARVKDINGLRPLDVCIIEDIREILETATETTI